MKTLQPNGKHLLMFAYDIQEYMDPEPEHSFRTIESKEKMEEWVSHMRKMPWSGTISNIKQVTPQEYFSARNSQYWKGYEERLDALAEDCTPEWVEEYNSLLLG